MKGHSWVVIPTYNEIANIEAIIHAIFKQNISNLSLLIVDDTSPDNTAGVVKKLQTTYPHLHCLSRPQKSGLGQAYVDGFNYAIHHGATQIVQMDADFSHNPSDIVKLLAQLETNDLVIGSRYIQGISVVNWPLRRLLISIGGNIYARIVTGLPIQDATGGFKAWQTQTLQDINFSSVKADGYGFQIIMNHRAWKVMKKIKEIPIIFTERREGQSKMSKAIVREALILVWKLRFNLK